MIFPAISIIEENIDYPQSLDWNSLSLSTELANVTGQA